MVDFPIVEGVLEGEYHTQIKINYLPHIQIKINYLHHILQLYRRVCLRILVKQFKVFSMLY